MEDPNNKHRSIAKHIVDGTITIDSISEFKSMLQVISDNPALYTAYADLLVKKQRFDEAAASFGLAADQYLGAGQMLPSLVAKIMQWRIKKPSHDEASHYFSRFQQTDFPNTPLKRFFDRLSYPEWVGITNRIARVRLLPDKMVKKIGDVEDAFYLVASGALRETVYKPLQKEERTQKKLVAYLAESDAFGNILPFDAENISQSFIESISSVELAKLSKKRLAEICEKFPNIDDALRKFIVENQLKLNEDSLRGDRKGQRQPLPIQINLQVLPDRSSDDPFVLQSYLQDISVGGACVVIDAKFANISSVDNALKRSRIQVCFPGKGMTLNVDGKIVWSRKVSYEGEKTLALGIQFESISPKMNGMLMVFADMLNTG